MFDEWLTRGVSLTEPYTTGVNIALASEDACVRNESDSNTSIWLTTYSSPFIEQSLLPRGFCEDERDDQQMYNL